MPFGRGDKGDAIWEGFASMMFGELRRHDRVASVPYCCSGTGGLGYVGKDTGNPWVSIPYPYPSLHSLVLLFHCSNMELSHPVMPSKLPNII